MVRQLLLGNVIEERDRNVERLQTRLETHTKELTSEINTRIGGMESFLAREVGDQDSKLKREVERLNEENSRLKRDLKTLEQSTEERLANMEDLIQESIASALMASSRPTAEKVEKFTTLLSDFGRNIVGCLDESPGKNDPKEMTEFLTDTGDEETERKEDAPPGDGNPFTMFSPKN